MKERSLIPHLFKNEYSKMVAVLTRSFGLEYMEIAEDIVSETFVTALDTWPYRGTPENPTAWLYTVAKNKLKNHLNRTGKFSRFVSEWMSDGEVIEERILDFSDKNIADSQLQMLFAICHPSISSEAQICLALRVLCGLGPDEIADAFFSNKETIRKRLQRAKEKLSQEKIKIEMPHERQIGERLDTVLQTIYLLFSEGYYSESNRSIVRKELCVEALNLTYLLLDSPLTNTHATNALMSLMCFQASRLDARQSSNEGVVLYEDQDRSLWDSELVEKGFYYLQQASKWEVTSTYYIEASVAYWYTVEDSMPDKWSSILKLYDLLLTAENSPIVALNRIWAFSKVHGNEPAIVEAEKLSTTSNYLYFLLLAELYRNLDEEKADRHLSQALLLCKSEAGRKVISEKLGTQENRC
jgi:RNA polymerase sigma factor (sigma-70 family)